MERDCIDHNLLNESLFYPKHPIKSIFITTNGCSENRFDCAKMERFFLKNGWRITGHVIDADLILFNACGVTTIAENASINTLSEINALKKESAEVIIWGCFPKININRISKAHRGVIFTQNEAEHLEDFFEADIKSQNIDANHVVNPWNYLNEKEYAHSDRSIKKAGLLKRIVGNVHNYVFKEAEELVSFVKPGDYFIKVSTGCLNACTYCGVRYSRGRVRSEPIDKIAELFNKGIDLGYRVFTLIGTDLGSYGRDRGTTLAALLECLIGQHGDFQLRLPNINPRWLIKMLPQFTDIVSTGKVTAIGSAVQSGSDRVLERMRRQHNIEDYRLAIDSLKKAYPALLVRTNIIVGFPGETGRDFQRTLDLLKTMNFTYADIHRYASRPGTKAAMMKDPVAPATIESRYIRMKKTAAWNYLKKNYFNLPKRTTLKQSRIPIKAH
jgi:threonylcarbamoyladenosine tRNA methylthiotransferase CDKAL1